MKVVVDTNVLVAALSHKSQYHWLVRQILDGKFDLHVTGEIVLEYEEILIQKYSYTVANNFIAALKDLKNYPMFILRTYTLNGTYYRMKTTINLWIVQLRPMPVMLLHTTGISTL